MCKIRKNFKNLKKKIPAKTINFIKNKEKAIRRLKHTNRSKILKSYLS